ncbi:MAG: hypothetical protein PHP86_01180 [Nevskiales bacterium]|nr:hypothetical protein [Nevskiales bacterium]
MHPYHLSLRTKAQMTRTKAYVEADPLHFKDLDVLTVLGGIGFGLVPYLLDPGNMPWVLTGLAGGTGAGYLATVYRRLRVRDRRRGLLGPALQEIIEVEQEHPQLLRTIAERIGIQNLTDRRLQGALKHYPELLRDPDRYWYVLNGLIQHLEHEKQGPVAAT